jgi:hypothetical protein
MAEAVEVREVSERVQTLCLQISEEIDAYLQRRAC